MARSGCRPPASAILSLVVSLFALNPMMAGEAAAIILEATPSVQISEGWNSNAFNTGGDTVSSFGTRLTPALALRFFTGEESSFRLYGSYGRTWYNNPDAKGAEGSTINFRLDSPEGVKFTPNWSLNPSAYYIHTTNSFSRIELLPSGDPVLPPVTITNYGNTRTDDLGAAASINYKASPSLTFGLNGSYAELGFTGSDGSMRIGGIASVSYLYSPLTTLGLVAAGNRQTYPSQPDSNTLSGGIQLGYKFSPVLHFDVTIGMSHIQQSAAPGGTESSSSSPSGLFSVTYQSSETFTARFYGSALYSGYGYSTPTRQGTVGLSLDDRFSRDWSWNLSGSYQISRAVFASNAEYLQAVYASAGVGYRPWSWGGLHLTGNWNHQTSGAQSGSNLDTYSVVLGFTIGHSYIVF